jgi:predicted HAD superfamily Cof-like phosphohydrolase
MNTTTQTPEQMLIEWETASASGEEKTFSEILKLRTILIEEEYHEVREAIFDIKSLLIIYSSYTREPPKKLKANLLKELCDLVYVCIGTAVKLGLPFDEGFARVHANNMSKLVDGKIVRAPNGKILKPEGYTPVDLKDIV